MQFASEAPASITLAPIPPRRGRRAKTPFQPPRQDGPYRMPDMLFDRASNLLADTGNREECWRGLNYLLASNPIDGIFPIDERALNGRLMLRMTQGQIKGMTKSLLKVALIERVTPEGDDEYQRDALGNFKLNAKGNRIRKLELFKHDASGKLIRDQNGKPIRKPILYRFSATVRECYVNVAPPRRRIHKPKCRTANLPTVERRYAAFAKQERQASQPTPPARPLPKWFSGSNWRVSEPDSQREAAEAHLPLLQDAFQQEPPPKLSAEASKILLKRDGYGRIKP